MNDAKFDFESLSVYQKSLDFIDSVYKISSSFPDYEKYGLKSQFTRAANSIALNIAEGYGESNNLFSRYLKISKGSVRECVVCTSISLRREYISAQIHNNLRADLFELSKMLMGLQKFIQRQPK